LPQDRDKERKIAQVISDIPIDNETFEVETDTLSKSEPLADLTALLADRRQDDD
jgi:hypothetical protein